MKTNTQLLTEIEHTLDGYRKALRAVKVNGTSMEVINSLTELVNNTRTRRNELLDLLNPKKYG